MLRESMRQSSENLTQNLATILPLIPGMPIRLTQNIAVEKEGHCLAWTFLLALHSNMPSFLSPVTGIEVLNRMKMRQLPFVPAFACTTYIVQGITADGLVPFPLIAGGLIPPPFAALYVVFSRVRSLKSLFLNEAIGEEHVRRLKSPLELIEENIRLRGLTIRNLESKLII